MKLKIVLLLMSVFLHARAAEAQSVDIAARAIPACSAESYTHALVVWHKGRFLCMSTRAPFTFDSPHLLWSVSKSLFYTFGAAAAKQGLITLDDRVSRYIPDFAQKNALKNKTVRDVVGFDSGLGFSEIYEEKPMLSSVLRLLYGSEYASDSLKLLLQHELSGVGPSYSSGDAHLFSHILKRALGDERYRRFPYENLGLGSLVFESSLENVFWASSYAHMNVFDMVAFARHYLEFARSPNSPLASDWARNAFTTSLPSAAQAKAGGVYLGNSWWLLAKTNTNLQRLPNSENWPPRDRVLVGYGHNRQALLVDPAHDLIVVHFGKHTPEWPYYVSLLNSAYRLAGISERLPPEIPISPAMFRKGKVPDKKSGLSAAGKLIEFGQRFMAKQMCSCLFVDLATVSMSAKEKFCLDSSLPSPGWATSNWKVDVSDRGPIKSVTIGRKHTAATGADYQGCRLQSNSN